MKIHKVIKILIHLYLLFSSVEVFAAYGESCPSAPIPSSAPDNYLINDTAYGQVIRNIDMKEIQGGCDPLDKQFKFCVKQISTDNSGAAVIKCVPFALNVGDTTTLSEIAGTGDPQLGGNYLLKDIRFKVQILPNQMMCLTMPTSRGTMPVACKTTSLPPPDPTPADEQCRVIGDSCYGTTKSQSLFNFSGLAVDCVKESLDKVFFQSNQCQVTDKHFDFTTYLNPFSYFHNALKASVRVALMLYVVFYGINMGLSQEYGKIDKIAVFIIKLVFVAYFAVGFGPVYFKEGKETRDNGMLVFGLPLLTNFTHQFAEIVFNAAGAQGLCEFDREKYQKGYSHYGIWDAIDCRIGYYLGLELLYNHGSALKDLHYTISGDNTGESINFPASGKPVNVLTDSESGVFRFFAVMFGFFTAGNIIVLVSGIVFCVIFLSIMLYFLTNYLVCLVTIYVMTYISPIFIPMVLFTKTKAYFDAWLKICLSCALQPAVIAGFIALLVTMYDSAIYRNCKFVRYDYTYNEDIRFSTFDIRLPSSNQEECRESSGYKLLQYYSGYGWDDQLFLIFKIKHIAKDVLSLLLSLLYVLVFSIIFYYFSKSIGRFAAEITGGPIMDQVTASPTKVVEMVKQGMSYLKAGAEAASGKMPGQNPADTNGKGGGSGGGGGDAASSSGGGGGGDAASTS